MRSSAAVRRTDPPALPHASRGVAYMPGGWTPRRHPELGDRMRVAWEASGPENAPALFVLGGISQDRHVTATANDPRPGWWSRQVGLGRTIDPSRWRIVGMDFLGSRKSAVRFENSPFENSVESVFRGRLHLTPEDQADAVFSVLDHLEIERVHALVGASFGGSVALAAALARPERVGRLVMIGAAHRSHPHATALRLVQRRIVEMAVRAGTPKHGLSLARGLGFTTYRTAAEFEERFASRARWNTGNAPVFEVAGYLDRRGKAFAASTDAKDFLTLSEAVDLCDLDPAGLSVPMYLVSFELDTLVPPWLVAELEERTPGFRRHFRLATKCGHDSFLTDSREVSGALAASLAQRQEEDCR